MLSPPPPPLAEAALYDPAQAPKASGWCFLCPGGIFMGLLFGFVFATLLRILLLFFRLVVTSSLQGILLRKITQLLPEA